MKKLLLTCFEPFGGEERNVSMDTAALIPDLVGEFEIEKLCLPVEFGRAADIAVKCAKDIHADIIISLGQAGARKAITPEMVAINLRYASIPDNAKAMPQDVAVIADAPNAYFSTLPVRKMTNDLKENGVSAAVSYSAGTYVCNDLYFGLLHNFSGTNVRVAFIHLPKASETVCTKTMAKALEKMIERI